MAAVPTTLGVGVSLARASGGNEGLALLLTVVSNMLGVLTVPLWLKAFFHDNDDMNVGFSLVELLVRLIITVFIPSVLGKAMRELWPAAKRFANKHRTALSLFSTANLAFIIWQTLSGAQSIIVRTPFVNTLYVILLASAQHIIYVIFNFAALL